MQQAWGSRPAEGLSSVGGGLSLGCSRCAGRDRLGTLASLRTAREPLPQRPPGAPSPGPSGGRRSPPRRRRTRSAGVGPQDEEEEEVVEEDARKNAEGLSRILFLSLPSPPHPTPPTDPGPDPRPAPGCGSDPDPRPAPGGGSDPDPRPAPEDVSRWAGLEAAVRGRLAVLLHAADGSMQRRLARLSWELARTDTELLCERAHWRHLARERQAAAERQRALSRQVDVAVSVIAAMREQLNASEDRLEQREREALSIQSFLAAAARQEASGRLRLQSFIEALLERIALAERRVRSYQGEEHAYCQRDRPPTQLAEQARHRMSKCRSAGGQPYSGFHDNRSSSSSSRPSLDRDLDQDQDPGWVWEPRQRCRSLGYEV